HHARRKLCRPADGGLGGWAEKVRPTKASWRRSGVPPQCFSPLPRAVEGPGVRALWRIAAGTSLLREGPNSRRIFSFRRFGTKTFLIFVIPVPPHSPSTMALNLPGRPNDGIRVRACRARARDRALDRRCGHGHAGTVAGRAALQESCRARRLLRARGKPLRG